MFTCMERIAMKWMKLGVTCWFICSLSLVSAQTIVIGAESMNPPFSTRTDSSHFIGFEIDIMNEICNRLQLTCVYQAIVTNQIIYSLESGKIDLAIDTIIIPSFRLYSLILSLPYLASSSQFMTLKESNIQTIDDVAKKVIGVKLSAFQINVLSDLYVRHLFKTEISVKGYLTLPELLAALENHEVDVVFENPYSLNYWNNSNPGRYKFVGESYHMGNGYGILAPYKSQQLIMDMNRIIKNIMADGTYDMIYKRYFAQLQ